MNPLGRFRQREPRLKAGFTWTRLVAFWVVVAVLAVLAEHFASGTYPQRPSNCDAKGINSDQRKEGSCVDGNTKLVVVNEHTVLKLVSLDAKLEGVRERKTLNGPAGSKTTEGVFLTFDLAVTNRGNAPAEFTEGQSVLEIEQPYGEDVQAEKDYEGRSFLAQKREIPPGGTENGTVTFAVPADGAATLNEQGNLDLENFDESSLALNPGAIFDRSEHGVIRTYQ